jgi:hypothetical protein
MTFVEVPPPDSVPAYSTSEKHGILSCLRIEENLDMFRCSRCGQMQPHGSSMVWVPDSIKIGDTSGAVSEVVRRDAYNGHLSGWCLKCARRLGSNAPKAIMNKTSPWWKRFAKRYL